MRFLITILLSLGLISCVSLVPKPGDLPKRFVLAKVSGHNGHTIPKQVMVDMPVVFPPLDNQRIALMPASQQIDYYANVEWADRLASLIQDSIIYSLQDNHLFNGVTRNVDGIIPDWTIKIDVRKFYIDISGNPKAVVEYFVQLLDTSNRKALDRQEFVVSLPIGEETPENISSKLDQCNQKIISDMIDWLSRR